MHRSATSPIRVLIVDDHPIVRQGYAQLLMRQDGFAICGEAADVVEALAAAQEQRPHLALVDISLKESNGLELIKCLKSSYEALKILVASAHDESLFADRVLQAGADGYISKQETVDHLVTAIHRILEGDIYLSERMTQRVLGRAKGASHEERSPIERLSNRELEVFQMIGDGLTTRAIAGKMQLSPKTVDRYRENIKSKLGIDNAAELIRHATRWVLENR